MSPSTHVDTLRDSPAPRALRRVLAPLLAIAMLAPVATRSFADDKAACGAAYASAQELKDKGQFSAAREQIAVCTRSSCKDWVIADCTRWLEEIERKQPSVVLVAETTRGESVDIVKVTDASGRVLSTALTGRALNVDPGQYALTFTSRDGRTSTVSRLVAEGQKDVTIKAVFPAKEDTKPTLAKLSVVAGASDAIAIDRASAGVGRFDGNVTPGSHTLRVTGAGKKPYETSFEVTAGAARTIEVKLEPDNGGGVPTWVWIAGGAVIAGGLVAGGYFLFKPADAAGSHPSGGLGTAFLPLARGVSF